MKAKKRVIAQNISVSPDDVKSHKIHSINSSVAPGGGNRQKRITVRGIPGSVFSVMVQDENNNVYSFRQGSFNGTPTPLSGIIPPNGVFKTIIDTGRSESVNIRLNTGSPDAATTTIGQSIASHSVTIAAVATGLNSSHYSIGTASFTSKPISPGGDGVFDFEFVIEAAGGKVVNIVRNTIFNYEYSLPTESGFVLYDGETFEDNQNAHQANLDGVALRSDFKIVETNNNGHLSTPFVIEGLTAKPYNGISEVIPSGSVGHSAGVTRSALVKGTVRVSTMGYENLTINLMLYNFLELIDPA